ncbi:hypothetical protein [Ornithinibacillus halophilus]|uniref:Similar to spore coat protein n=1 Tax=Ornithinibacillus halophilus TaxID=930117 RepID=A0A1M5F477_9BACI|nr:hypothetical protein [Ornithinibacillus halophilus]SHF86188.1 similar to spore coat protein [Ornithinibacillus halophilus]
MESQNFGVHEITDFRELTSFKISCLTQSKKRLDMAQDPQLKNIVSESILQGEKCITEMQELLNKATNQFLQ